MSSFDILVAALENVLFDGSARQQNLMLITRHCELGLEGIVVKRAKGCGRGRGRGRGHCIDNLSITSLHSSLLWSAQQQTHTLTCNHKIENDLRPAQIQSMVDLQRTEQSHGHILRAVLTLL